MYAAYNIDCELYIIDGKNTFHVMGIIGTVTPGVWYQKKEVKSISKQYYSECLIDVTDVQYETLP
ncbi:hypothetical protein PR048_001870 [Dryococelus australis]|uniref:Uncharacterized protein n=1 Tax=Dryococelus australis TaxID=614101 RepID=A0ABQ9IJN1_9NEOP|nr:hypothetical protein PR048_001870 [Dryococelus australis]